jgi:hypothetical protein
VKIIFLDVDGVLNSTDYFRSDDFQAGRKAKDATTFWCNHISDELIKELNKILEATGAKIVVSSSWRKSNHLDSVFKVKGITFIDCTKNWIDKYINTGYTSRRGQEIEEWLERHPEVESYVILDDDSDMLESQKKFFIKVDREIGLCDSDCNKAIEILNQKDSTNEKNI